MANPAQAPSVLIVDDEESIQKLVAFNFERGGFTTKVLGDGQEAYTYIRRHAHELDVVILDVMLPGMEGIDVCKRLRQEGVRVPIILLTARDEEVDRILGLELGADDYVTKPFSPRELVARAKAVLRRVEAMPSGPERSPEEASTDQLTVGEIAVHLGSREVTVRGVPVELTPREFELLHFFIRHPNQVLSRDQLLEQVWGYLETPDTRSVDVHVSHLREKLERDPKAPAYLLTVRGVGYKFVNGSREES
ncbi:MAG: response regulator transcription factor [Alicyclobacillus sp.]|nr:response regulator transcription factor [Alicyclobacillus sp.]